MRTYVRLGLLAAALAVAALAGRGTPAYAWTDPAVLNTNAASDSGSDQRPQVATDGAGNWVAVWESGDSLGGTIGTDFDILVARSTNNGITWTDPQPLNTDAPSDSGDDWIPQVATDGQGTWVAVWQWRGTGTGSVKTSRSTNNGLSWTDEQTIKSPFGGLDAQHPRVAVDQEGRWIVVFQARRTFRMPGDPDWGPDDEIWASHSSNGGVTWTECWPVNNNAAVDYKPIPGGFYHYGDWNPDVARDGAGNLLVVWESDNPLGGAIGDDWDILFARSLDGGAWTDPAVLNTNAASDGADDDDWDPRVATDGQGTFVATWWLWAPTRVDVQVAKSTDLGAHWTKPISLSSGGPDVYPDVANDGGSNWLVVWNGVWHAFPDDYDIIVSRTADGAATWSAPAPFNSNAATDSGDDFYPQVTTDGAGHWVAVWMSWDDLGGTIGTDSDILYTTEYISDGAPPISSVAVGTDVYGFGRDAGNSYWNRHWNGTSWEAWSGLGGILGTSPSAVAAGGDVYVFGLDAGGGLWYRRHSGGSWGGWQALGGILSGQVSGAATASNDVYVFGRDAGGGYWYRHWNGTSWEAWSGLGGVLSTSPFAVAASGDVYVSGLDAGGGLWYQRRSGGSWGGWQALGGILSGQVSGVATASNDVYVFGRDAGGGYWYRHWNGTSWEDWSGLGGILSTSPSAVAAGGDVYVFGPDAGGGLWYRRFSGGSWGGWQALGGVLSGKPSAAALGSTDVYVFGLGGDSGLWYRHRDGTIWQDWSGLGGILAP